MIWSNRLGPTKYIKDCPTVFPEVNHRPDPPESKVKQRAILYILYF